MFLRSVSRLVSCKACTNLLPINASEQVIQTVSVRGYKRHVPALLRELYVRKKKEGPKPPTPRRDFLEWNYEAELFAFGARLGEKFDSDILKRAFISPSYCEKEGKRQRELGIDKIEEMIHNQELCDQGRLISNDYIKAYLRQQLPYYPEEGISAIHDFLLTDQTLADIALHLGIKELLLASEYPPSEHDMASAMLAVVACVDASSGRSNTEAFLRDCVISYLAGKDINEYFSIKNPMGVLGEILKRSGRGPPEPRITRESGPNTILASYFVGIYSDKQFLSEGTGESIDVAIEMAAREALKRMFRSTEGSVMFDFGSKFAKDVELNKKNPPLTEWTQKLAHTF